MAGARGARRSSRRCASAPRARRAPAAWRRCWPSRRAPGWPGRSSPIGRQHGTVRDGEVAGGDRAVTGRGEAAAEIGSEAHGASSLAPRRRAAGQSVLGGLGDRRCRRRIGARIGVNCAADRQRHDHPGGCQGDQQSASGGFGRRRARWASSLRVSLVAVWVELWFPPPTPYASRLPDRASEAVLSCTAPVSARGRAAARGPGRR